MEDLYNDEHIVDFYLCNFCEHKKKKECEEPCCDCLDYGGNFYSRRPIHFKDNGSLAKLLKEEVKESQNK